MQVTVNREDLYEILRAFQRIDFPNLPSYCWYNGLEKITATILN